MKKLLVAAAFVSSAAFAAGAAKTDAKTGAFHTLDQDHDGHVTSQEAASDSELNTHFATLDKDGDGKLSEAEFKAHKAHKGHEKKAK